MKPKRVYHWKVVADFLIRGVSVAGLSRKYGRSRHWVEDVLRRAM